MKKITLLIMIFLSMIGISQNLLTNGDFENGTTGWVFGPPGVVASGEAFYSTANAGGNPWDTELKQTNLSFTGAASYTLTFRARAAANRNISVNIQNTNIWNDQFRNNAVALTTTMTTYSYTFNATSTNNNAQLNFHMANMGVNTTAAVYIDDVELVLNEGGGGDTPPAQPVGFVANTPTSSSLFLAVGPNNVGGEIEYRLFYSPTATAPANPLTATQYSFGSTPGDGNGFSAFGFTLTGLNSGTNYTLWLYQYNSTTGLYSSPNSVTGTTLSGNLLPQPVGFVAVSPTSSSIFLAVGPNNTGGNIVYKLFYSPTATAPANPLTATEYTFGSTPGDANGANAFGFALGGLTSQTNYTFWLYQYNTVTQAYSLPASSTNTTLFAPAPLVPPTTNAPVPTRNSANVVSIYSNTYSNIATNYDPNWGQSGHNLVNTNFVAVPASGNTILHYPNFNYQGTQLTATNLSSMEFLHVDLWTNAATSNAIIQVSPINAGTGPAEVLVTINHVQGQWVSVDIPKSAFGGMTWDNVFQMKFAANGPGSTTPIDIYLDNVYFWNNPGVSTDATLSDLQVDFAPVDGFSPSQLSYTYNIPFGTTEIPQITSATPNSGAASAVINQATSLPGSATVVVTAEDDSVQQTYTVNFSFPPPPAQPVGFVAFNPTASSAFLACGPNNVNGNIVYRLFYSPTATAPVDPTTAAEYNFGDTPGDGGGAGPFGFNIPGLTSSTNYTFWLYQYNTETNQFSSPGTASLTTLCLPLNWYADVDGDGFGDDSTLVSACNSPGLTYVLVGGDCNDNANTIYPGATEICYDGILQNCNGDLNDGCPAVLTQIRPYFCGSTLQNVNSSILADVPTGLLLGAAVTGYRYEITNLSTNVVREVEKTIAMVRISETDIAGFGTAYSIRVAVRINQVWQDYGTPCSIFTPSIPTTTVSTLCGQTLPSIQSTIFATPVTSALGYEFEVSRIEGGIAVETTTIERLVNNFKITSLSGIDYVYSSEYQVRVRVNAEVNGVETWSDYGTVCSVFTPVAPEAAIEGCGSEVGITPAALSTPIFATPILGATLYRFTLSDGNGYSQVYTTPSRFFRLSNFNALSPLTPGGNYSVTVEAEIYGYFYAGKDCNILVPGGMIIRPVDVVKEVETIKDVPTEFNAIAYPNPFATSFAIDVRTSNTEAVSLTVYDMAGRLLEVKEFNVSEVANYQFGDRYPSGVYNMIVTQGEETRTVRVVKQ